MNSATVEIEGPGAEVMAEKMREIRNPSEEKRGSFKIDEVIVMKGCYFCIKSLSRKQIKLELVEGRIKIE